MLSTLRSTQNDFEEKLKECENKPEELSETLENQEIEIENQEPKFEPISITVKKLKKQAEEDFKKMTGRQREETLKTCFSKETLQNLIQKLVDYISDKEDGEWRKVYGLVSFLLRLVDSLNGLLEDIEFSDVPGHENYSNNLEGKFEFALDYAYPYLCKEKKKEFVDIVRDYSLNSKSDYSQEHKLIE